MVAYNFKERFIAPITKGLGREFIEGWGSPIPVRSDIRPKRQTIRAIGKRRHARPGEILQLYYGMRTKQCRSIGVARCTRVTPIRIMFDDIVFWIYVDDIQVRREVSDDFARKDGFADVRDMQKFWLAEHKNGGKFTGVLIEWDPIHG